MTRVELFRALAPLVGSLGDGHTYLNAYLPEYRAYREHGGALFPLELDCSEQTPVVVADYDTTPEVPPGAALTSIRGVRASEVVDRLARYNSGDGPASRRFGTCTDIRTYAWIDGLKAPFAVTFRLPHSAIVHHAVLAGATIGAIHRWDATPAAARRFGSSDFAFTGDGAVGILTLHAFDDDASFRSATERLFEQLALRRSSALLIDVRENTGGSTAPAEALIDGFANHPYRIASRTAIQVSRLAKTSLGFRTYSDIYGDAAWHAPDGSILRENVELRTPRSVPHPFRGRVFVLVGAGTLSTAAMFAAAVQDARFGSILGAPSGGNATLDGERFDFMLPASGLSASVSTKFFVRPDGDARLGPVVPDLRLAETAQVDPVDDELRAALLLARATAEPRPR